jgi:hypothetical protein
LSISAAVIGSVFAVVFFVWYPQPLFEVVGGWYLRRLLFLVDVVLGPVLTLIVFKPGKPGLRFDLTVIAIIQVVALVYGTATTFRERPYYLMFAVDRFEVVANKDVDQSQIRYDALREKPWIGPIKVFARLPEDPDALSAFMEEVLFEGKPDLNRRPEYWHPYDDHASNVSAEAIPVSALLEENDDIATKARQLAETYKGDHRSIGLVPLLGRDADYSMVIDMDTGEQLEIIDIDLYVLNVDKEPQAIR